ncbi:hypothetical protein FC697_22110 [Bacillus wiedmannii]|uniref:hypothetical protein n=1 Tax=Bacillus wiedmannii TaxID=1890302 RepID=UPI0010BD128D|nr:hypothetical protein [Bacillus wiedmannii]TKH17597.1 hypothetical protein FC697_22110 [Bacillus wiedmannii]
MATQNPYLYDNILGNTWEQGYLAGFNEPEVDHLRPYSSDLLQVYQEGEQSGRDDRRSLPPDEVGINEQGNQSEFFEFLKELADHAGLHVLGHRFFEMVFKDVGGLIPLVLTSLQISTDSPIHPLEEDWQGPANQSDNSESIFIAVCPLKNHPQVLTDVTTEGYWTGKGHQFYSDALAEMQAHGHAEAFIARCSVTEGTCGAVWPGRGQ